MECCNARLNSLCRHFSCLTQLYPLYCLLLPSSSATTTTTFSFCLSSLFFWRLGHSMLGRVPIGLPTPRSLSCVQILTILLVLLTKKLWLIYIGLHNKNVCNNNLLGWRLCLFIVINRLLVAVFIQSVAPGSAGSGVVKNRPAPFPGRMS